MRLCNTTYKLQLSDAEIVRKIGEDINCEKFDKLLKPLTVAVENPLEDVIFYNKRTAFEEIKRIKKENPDIKYRFRLIKIMEFYMNWL